MAKDRILRTFDREAHGMSAAVIEQLAELNPATCGDALTLATRTGYSIGFEIGLNVALMDPVAGRRLQAFFEDVVQRSDPEAEAARDHHVRNWLAGARVD